MKRDPQKLSTLNPLVVLATGGTGGHIFPAQALAQEMLLRDWRVAFLIDKRAEKFAAQFPAPSNWEIIPVATITQGAYLKRLVAPLMMGLGVIKVLIKFIVNRPSAVVGFGSYVSLPPLIGALLLKIPSVIHEQNSTMGKVNRLMASRVSRIASGSNSPNFPNTIKWHQTGNPIRREIIDKIPPQYSLVANERIEILVVGGSQGASKFDMVIPEGIMQLPSDMLPRISITQQVRPDKLTQVENLYNGIGLKNHIKPFFSDLPTLMAKAHLVIARAGASTIAEITAMGLPSILIPFAAAANDHQATNAKTLETAGAALVVTENNFTPDFFAIKLQELLNNPDQIRNMAEVSKSLSTLNAAKHLADLVEDIVKKEGV